MALVTTYKDIMPSDMHDLNKKNTEKNMILMHPRHLTAKTENLDQYT